MELNIGPTNECLLVSIKHTQRKWKKGIEKEGQSTKHQSAYLSEIRLF